MISRRKLLGCAVAAACAPFIGIEAEATKEGYIAYAHPDAEDDICNMPGFVPVAGYSSVAKIEEMEFGSYSRVSFIFKKGVVAYE